jgi:cation transport ATPase
MGTPPPGPAATPLPLLHFPYSNPEPWSWIPGTWIHAGNVFVTVEGRFYRFVERTDDGWKAEEVEPSAVGDQARVAEITGLRARYEQVLAAHDELDSKMQKGADTPESRALLRERDEELHQLRDQLILLCNGRSFEARAAKRSDQDSWKLTLTGVLALVFVLSVISCVKFLHDYVPEQVGGMAASGVFFLSGAALFVIGVRALAKHKNRLVTGNLVGCYTLFTIALVVAAFGIMFVSVALLYTGAYGK